MTCDKRGKGGRRNISKEEEMKEQEKVKGDEKKKKINVKAK